MVRTLTLFGSQLILWVLVSQLNHSLSDAHVYLFLAGLYLTFGAITQPFGAGLASAMMIGAVCDANAPIAFGTHVMLFGLTHILLCRLRGRIPRDDMVSRVVIAVLTNLAVFLALSLSRMVHSPVISANWPRLLWDLICSQVLITLIAPWFFALQERALVLTRVERELAV
jgi:cell shape-determining protein MreD